MLCNHSAVGKFSTDAREVRGSSPRYDSNEEYLYRVLNTLMSMNRYLSFPFFPFFVTSLIKNVLLQILLIKKLKNCFIISRFVQIIKKCKI